MDPARKKIVTDEIKYWQQSQLLPNHYCEFLLNLYNEGKPEQEASTHHWRETKWPTLLFSVVLLSLITTIVIIYFTDFSIGMQTVLSLFFTIIIASCVNPMRKWSIFLSQLFLFSAGVTLFLGSLSIVLMTTEGSSYLLIVTLLFHGVVWLIIGIKWKIRLFTLASAGIILFTILFWLQNQSILVT